MIAHRRRTWGSVAGLAVRDRVSLLTAAAVVVVLGALSVPVVITLVHSGPGVRAPVAEGRTTTGPPSSTASATSGLNPIASASVSPSVRPSRSPAPRPAPTAGSGTIGGGFPDASNTGVPAGTKLQRVPQDITAGPGWHWEVMSWGEGVLNASAGAMLTGLDVNGPVYNNDGVDSRSAGTITITNSRIRCTGEGTLCLTLGPASKVTNTEIGGGPDGRTFVGALGVVCGNWTKGQTLTTLTRVNVHHVVQGFHMDGDCTIRDSYLHTFVLGDKCTPGCDGAHSEAIFAGAKANNSLIHSTVGSGNSANFFCQNNDNTNPVGGVVVDSNRFIFEQRNGQGPSYAVAVQATCPPALIRNNVFDNADWQAGPGQAPAGSTVTGNVFTDGSPAPFTTAS